jgi:hypothetical protein
MPGSICARINALTVVIKIFNNKFIVVVFAGEWRILKGKCP